MKKGFAPIFIIFAVAAILVAAGGVFYYVNKKSSPKLVACTLEARQCPDGSYVSRTGPNCEFAACPVATSTAQSTSTQDLKADWQTYRNEKYGFEVKYPTGWQLSDNGLFNVSGTGVSRPFFSIDNPDEPRGYNVYVLIGENPQKLSAYSYVTKEVSDINSTKHLAPEQEVVFEKEFPLSLSGVAGYELYNVFTDDVFGYAEGDEYIYLVNGDRAYRFVFPVPTAKLGFLHSVADNVVAHQILSTFKFIK